MVVELITASHFHKKADWPLRIVRAASFEKAPFSTFKLNDVIGCLKDYEGYLASHGIEHDLYDRADEVLNRGDVPAQLKSLITAIYDEGVELGKTLGKDLMHIKMPGASVAQCEAEIKKFGGIENLLGFHHVREFFDVAQRQAQASLFHEEGLITTQQLNAQMAETNALLVERGHYGIHAAVNENPTLKQLLLDDTRQIVAEYANGKATYGISSISNYTRGAYIRSEEAYAERLGGELAKIHANESIHRSLGKEYEVIFRKKWDAVGSLAAQHDFMRPRIEIANSALIPIMQGSGRMQDIDAMLAARRTFVGKHGLALLDPRTITAMEKSGKFDNSFWKALNEGMHAVIGSPTPFAPHVAEAATKTRAAGQFQQSDSVHEVKALPAPATHEVQKKTPQSHPGPSGQAIPEGAYSQEPHVPSNGQGPQTPTSMEKVARTAETSHAYMGGRLVVSSLGGLIIANGISHLREKKSTADDVEVPNKIRFARVLQVALGASMFAASWLVHDRSVNRMLGR